jgi:hypothetical protein
MSQPKPPPPAGTPPGVANGLAQGTAAAEYAEAQRLAQGLIDQERRLGSAVKKLEE